MFGSIFLVDYWKINSKFVERRNALGQTHSIIIKNLIPLESNADLHICESDLTKQTFYKCVSLGI